MGNDAIHQGHCSVFHCVYGDPACPVVEVEPGVHRGGAGAALDVLREGEPCVELAPICDICGFRHPAPPVDMATEYAVRNTASGWVYALPKVLPKFLDGKRGTRECAEWHRRQVAGPEPEDWTGFEIVERPVGAWKVVA